MDFGRFGSRATYSYIDASLKFIVEALQRNVTPSNAGSNVESFNEFDSKIDFSYGDV